MKPILNTDALSIAFGGLKAVDAVTIAAMPNEITTVIGPNGAGKTTLFNLISGALSPSSGAVYLDGKDVTRDGPAALQRNGLARSFQITNLFFEMTVRENLRLAAQVLEPVSHALRPLRRTGRAAQKVDELIDRFELHAKTHEQVGYLSHGEQRRLEIAMCLACEPKVLMLDEPTQGMSHADTEETEEMIRGLTDSVSILLIEHDIGIVMAVSDHVVVMHQGQKIADGTPDEVRANPAVQAAYFGHG
ncbi:amino acid/amide ABC transporter ATP-binding protein 1, HAAT family [Roseovarius pacificus]|uniref:Amino acid/amide ABC transporter ATP-binding protein 1, HAAT family n=1 Tax=Roseovarius pacificus TaxID=337701 RepID=A0A1M7A886_9RHOB|nr:ABC transporter ATP-binding protein [Roseovarius pacificus]GGO53775.1 ABC transporter ATP-binding protein [Roseovarius pacificus]SHL38900.1 amino acid/amide ABC transporter ATP-binding protein 1, HAAT family [Roseovarius pacificus]